MRETKDIGGDKRVPFGPLNVSTGDNKCMFVFMSSSKFNLSHFSDGSVNFFQLVAKLPYSQHSRGREFPLDQQ